MAKFNRYVLTIVCFVASISSLALWWQSLLHYRSLSGPTHLSDVIFSFNVLDGGANLFLRSSKSIPPWKYESYPIKPGSIARLQEPMEGRSFGMRTVGYTYWCFFPLWYAALLFALAGVAALRFRRQFSIRSALITMAVIASLLGMVVIL